MCNLFCRGRKVNQIVSELRKDGDDLSRFNVHAIIREAAQSGHFRYNPPQHLRLSVKISQRADLAGNVSVVHSIEQEAVAIEAAARIFELINGPPMQRLRNKLGSKDGELHIGFAGGRILQNTARLLAEKLKTAPRGFGRQICLHALVASFGDPLANPNSFLGYFAPRKDLPRAPRMVGLPAPGFIHAETVEMLRQVEGIRDSYEEIENLDLIITSGGAHWNNTKPCSYLHELHKKFGNFQQLNAAGCVGDIAWRPVSAAGPIELDQGYRAMTLIELSAFPKLIASGTRIMVVLGPCGGCGGPKDELLNCLLSWDRKHVTDLVLDSGTAAALERRWDSASSATAVAPAPILSPI